MNTFNQPREATIQFSDVFGTLPSNDCYQPITDFDAALTAQVRNTNRFVDAQFSIGSWPELGDYGAVLLEQLRQEQRDTAESLGLTTEDQHREDVHPDFRALAQSLGRTLVAIVNCAPRTNRHQENDHNGDEFYVGITNAGNEIYAQLPYFRGLRARGLLTTLFRIPNDAGVWTPGEQFRSSIVTQARTKPELLEPVNIEQIPKFEFDARVAYADKFGNVRLEVADIEHARAQLSKNKRVSLHVGALGTLRADVVQRLIDIAEGQLGIYSNPSEKATEQGPGYLELARRVSKPNEHTAHAYTTLTQVAEAGSESLRNINIALNSNKRKC